MRIGSLTLGLGVVPAKAATGPFDGHATLADGLVSYWALDEESGDRADSVGSNTLTHNNTVGFATVTPPPNFTVAKSALFVPANQETLSGSSSLTIPAATGATIICWIKRDPAINNARGAFSKSNGTNDEFYLQVNSEVGGVFKAQLNFVGGNGDWSDYTMAEGGAMTFGAWHYIVSWYNPDDKKAYLQCDNGTVIAGTPALTGTPFQGSNAFVLGTRSGYGATYYLGGELAHAGFWSRVLTSQERTDLYNSGAGLFY